MVLSSKSAASSAKKPDGSLSRGGRDTDVTMLPRLVARAGAEQPYRCIMLAERIEHHASQFFDCPLARRVHACHSGVAVDHVTPPGGGAPPGGRDRAAGTGRCSSP